MRWWLALAFLALLACHGDPTGSQVQSVGVFPSDTSIAEGDTVIVEARTANVESPRFVFSSSNVEVVRLEPGDEVFEARAIGVQPGLATVEVSIEGTSLRAESVIEVVPRP